jgi:hypothetical protein
MRDRARRPKRPDSIGFGQKLFSPTAAVETIRSGGRT